jgi:hypothetical protein
MNPEPFLFIHFIFQTTGYPSSGHFNVVGVICIDVDVGEDDKMIMANDSRYNVFIYY